ncbi:zinc finger protein 800b isoform X1 [Tachysurus vachellii]|uniref:zinc finger protein 800b isoform X1 n=3 Tax=Tachysurus vachellii TaxID=175792 RepID=UPI00296AF619|nr:zinc finger protein 800b isoform X1 [Tachysurus vachellii]
MVWAIRCRRISSRQIKDMEDLTAQIPSNEKSCQTDELEEKAPVLRPEHLNQMPAYCIEPGDPPLLQRQLQTSKSGIQQIIECFRTGTTQLKHILIKEVDTIFECKLCRSLFRGLPNLITHKEFYCFPRLPQPEPSGNCRQSLAIKELLEVTYPRPRLEDPVVRLEPIPGNQNAVFQHLTKPSDGDLHSSCQSSTHSMEDWKHNQQESKGQDMRERNTGVVSENEETNEGAGEAHAEKGAQRDEEQEQEEVIVGGMDDMIITCCLCGKGFSSRRSVHRHCRKVHKKRLEELRKFTETRTVPNSLLSVVKERQVHSPGPSRKCCPVCFKTFATNANVRRHFNEVHRGLAGGDMKWDHVTKSSDLEVMSAAPCAPHSKRASPLPQYNLATCKCLLCKRSYSTQARLKRHMHFVHKIIVCNNTVSSTSTVKKHQFEEGTDAKHTHERLKRPSEEDKNEKSPVMRKPKLSVGFDFKQLFCKLCRRQFSSRQNLAKHIEIHTDNAGEIFIKFYRCPLCRYESRRKRDVLRHVSVVHKKNSSYLAKILQGLESRAVKKPVEAVLGSSVKRGHAKDPDGHHKGESTSSHSPQKVSPSSSVPPVISKQEVPPPSPPVTRRQSLSLHTSSVTCNQNSNGMPTGAVAQDSTEVRVTKNFSLHACDVCGRAFAKKVYMESHRRSHRNAAKTAGRTIGMSTRSRSLLW